VSDAEIQVVEDADAVAKVTAERLARAAAEGGHVVLSGGSTPRAAYERAAVLAPDWTRVAVWWGDERCVPPDDERSNYRMAAEALLTRLACPPLAVHRIRGELGNDTAAEEYEQALAYTELDVVLLGVGPDGHVASLFPNSPSLDERERRVIGAEPRLEPFVDRVTMTLPALRAAREILFVLAGSEKAEAARRAFAGPPDPRTPASLVRSERGPTRVVLDRAAAVGLDS
jgi:6-phosphogluconolactonase